MHLASCRCPKLTQHTLMLAAPEVLETDMRPAASHEFWSLGCILYVMLFGRHPFLDQADCQDPSSKLKRTLCK